MRVPIVKQRSLKKKEARCTSGLQGGDSKGISHFIHVEPQPAGFTATKVPLANRSVHPSVSHISYNTYIAKVKPYFYMLAGIN
jgi:hypothetical protein